MARGTRPRHKKIEVWTTPEEKEAIEANAKRCRSRSTSEYLRELGQGFEPKSRFDQEFIKEIMALKADQGRLGGLLKLWLSERAGEGASVKNVRSILNQIEASQQHLARWILRETKKL
ncbi:MAG: conjugal transfer protein TraJ [Vampirovibrionales bacterium]|nr:conjugal transfer protein TraJ [Vampirovibrionales bacterium]